MSWLLSSLVGSKNDDEERDEVREEGNREGGVAEDLSQLRDTFTRQLRGFSSFLAGEDELPGAKSSRIPAAGSGDNDGPGTPKSGPGDTAAYSENVDNWQSQDRTGEEQGHEVESKGQTEVSGPAASSETFSAGSEEHARESPFDSSISDEADDAIPLTPSTSANFSGGSFAGVGHLDDSSENRFTTWSKLNMSGIQNDQAELSGTLKTHLSKFMNIVRVVTGEESQETPSKQQKQSSNSGSNDAGLEAAGNQKSRESENEYVDRQLGQSVDLGYSPPLASVGGIEVAEDDRGNSQPRWMTAKNLNNGEDDENSENESLLHAAKEDITAIRNSLASGISGISKFASNFLPFTAEEGSDGSDGDGWEGGNEYDVVAVNDQIIAFADSIAGHPETWIEFPLPSEDGNENFTLTEAQEQHVEGVEYAAPQLTSLRLELTPEHMSEPRFWKIYFVLLQSKLTPEDAAILVTPQVVEARNLVLEVLKSRAAGGAKGSVPHLSSDQPTAVPPNPRDPNSEAGLETPLVPVSDKAPLPLRTNEQAAEDIVDNDKIADVSTMVALEGREKGTLPSRVDELAAEGSVDDNKLADVSTRVALEGSGDEDLQGVRSVKGVEQVEAEQVSFVDRPTEPLPSPEVSRFGEEVVEDEAEVDDWLEDEDEAGGGKEAAGNEEEVSFSDLEDEADGEEDGGESESKRGSEDRAEREVMKGEKVGGWVELSGAERARDAEMLDEHSGVDSRSILGNIKVKREDNGSPCGSDRAESSGWQTIDKDDVSP